MNIPKRISNLAPEGSKVEYIGKYEGSDTYHAYYPEMATGFPFVYIVKGNTIEEFNGFEALDIVCKLVEE